MRYVLKSRRCHVSCLIIPYLNVSAVLRDGVSRGGRGEDAADPEPGGAGAGRRAALRAALARRKAGPVPQAGRRSGALDEQYYISF